MFVLSSRCCSRISAVLLSGVLVIVLATFASAASGRSAYVANIDSNSISVFDTQSLQLLGSPLSFAEKGPWRIAITPDGKHAYVTDYSADQVSQIDTQTNQVVGSPIPVGDSPLTIAITPNGQRAYVSNRNSDFVSVIDIPTNQVVGSPIPVGDRPSGVAVTPDGKLVYVANETSGTVSVIDTTTNQVVASIPVGENPLDISIKPDGSAAYVTGFEQDIVSVIDTHTNQVVGPAIPVGQTPEHVAVAPSGRVAYVGNFSDGTVSVIDTTTNQVIATIPLEAGVLGIAFTPDSSRAFVTNYENGIVTALNAQTNQPLGATIPSAGPAGGIAIVPDQGPVASFAPPRKVRPGVPVVFNGAASSDPDGSVALYGWNFGEGGSLATGAPSASHTFAARGTFAVTLTVTDNEGCSTSFIFTGQTASCNGSAAATQSLPVKVAYPGVRIKCPAGAKPSGCRLTLQAIKAKPKKGKKRRTKPQSVVSRLKLKAGRAATVPLEPKRAFAAKLATAAKILVKETITIDGAKRTVFRRLKVVQ